MFPPLSSVPRRRRGAALLAMALAALLLPAVAQAGSPLPTNGASSATRTSGARVGRPVIHLDRLEFPPGTPNLQALQRHVKRTLAREAKNLDWGAGQNDRVEYRFTVKKLLVVESDGVLTVTCTAQGFLPKGKRARSHLSFSGAPSERPALIRRVLDIVARGVLTRLAELERSRRGIAPLG